MGYLFIIRKTCQFLSIYLKILIIILKICKIEGNIASKTLEYITVALIKKIALTNFGRIRGQIPIIIIKKV